ncbi:hypothetical protein ACFYKX_11350 [Cytobacillus sp. FJAT-54145]|uniref:Uncharacterized protein n=1 Tax=Cytobacillus spartinae TaxID=3299023 RepID=A0ABW6KAG6_9BACI
MNKNTVYQGKLELQQNTHRRYLEILKSFVETEENQEYFQKHGLISFEIIDVGDYFFYRIEEEHSFWLHRFERIIVDVFPELLSCCKRKGKRWKLLKL